jgi:hypothetical protein
MKENNCASRLVYPTNLSFLIEGVMTNFYHKQKPPNQKCRKYLRDFCTKKNILDLARKM